jgi:hypothetical protein
MADLRMAIAEVLAGHGDADARRQSSIHTGLSHGL